MISHQIIVDVNANCKSLSVSPPGSVTVKSGVNLTIYEEQQVSIYGVEDQRIIIKKIK